MLFNVFLVYAGFALAPVIGFLATWGKRPSAESHIKLVLLSGLIALVWSMLWVFLEVPLRTAFGGVPPANPETVLDFLGLQLTGVFGSIMYVLFAMLSSMILYVMGAFSGWLANLIEPSLR